MNRTPPRECIQGCVTVRDNSWAYVTVERLLAVVRKGKSVARGLTTGRLTSGVAQPVLRFIEIEFQNGGTT